MRITTTLAPIAAAAALVVGTVAPASAATQDRTDPTGDAVSTFGSPSDDALRASDIVELQGRHGDGRLVFTITVADLGAQGREGTDNAAVRMQTPSGRDYYAVIGRTAEGKEAFLLRETEDGFVPTDCEDFAGRAFAARDEYVFSIPRSCVRNPREVRFGAGVSASDANNVIIGRAGTRAVAGGQPSNGGTASDDARRDGSVGQQVRLGTRALANN